MLVSRLRSRPGLAPKPPHICCSHSAKRPHHSTKKPSSVYATENKERVGCKIIKMPAKSRCEPRVSAGWGEKEYKRKIADESDPTTHIDTVWFPTHHDPCPGRQAPSKHQLDTHFTNLTCWSSNQMGIWDPTLRLSPLRTSAECWAATGYHPAPPIYRRHCYRCPHPEPQSGYLKSIRWPWTTGLFPSRAYAIVPAFRL